MALACWLQQPACGGLERCNAKVCMQAGGYSAIWVLVVAVMQ